MILDWVSSLRGGAKGGLASRPETPPQAFTLIELLVVIAIIGILASLLLPSLSRARSQALATECRSNLREIGLAFRMYVDEFEHYPLAQGKSFTGISTFNGLISFDDWKETILPYVGLSLRQKVVNAGDPEAAVDLLKHHPVLRKLRCPQVVRNAEGAPGNGQYAYNASGTARFRQPANLGLGGYLQGLWHPTRETRVVAPSEMIAVGDVSPGVSIVMPLLKKEGDGEAPPLRTFFSSGHFDPASPKHEFWPGKGHNGRSIMLFADGHVETARQTNWIAATEAARRRWNNDHAPHPETWKRP
jgi:prepilin-type N-terminal cleavage/methylation domain-containing protein/prepilin-type processing-associated H-X9-DG protein